MIELKNKLIQELDNLISLLNKHQERNWSNHFSKMRDLIDINDINGIESLRNLHRGGMGSFNDFYINTKDKSELITTNNQILKSGKTISDLANTMKQELNKTLPNNGYN